MNIYEDKIRTISERNKFLDHLPNRAILKFAIHQIQTNSELVQFLMCQNVTCNSKKNNVTWIYTKTKSDQFQINIYERETRTISLNNSDWEGQQSDHKDKIQTTSIAIQKLYIYAQIGKRGAPDLNEELEFQARWGRDRRSNDLEPNERSV